MVKNKTVKKWAAEYGLNEKYLAGVYDWTGDIAINDVARILRQLNIAKEVVRHEVTIDKDRIFGDIESAINTLTELKKKGYDCFEEKWSGYEDNYLVASISESETDDEYFRRVAEKVDEVYSKEKEEKAKQDHKQKRIQQLEKELAKLKGE